MDKGGILIPTILGCKKCRPTGRLLAAAFGAYYREDQSNDDITIRYGNAHVPDASGMMINKLDAVRTSSNKPTCKQLLMNANIPTPRRFSFEEARSGNVRFPLLVRKNGHFKGRYFYIVSNCNELMRYDPRIHYVQEIVDKIDEYRLFIMKDRIIEADLKEVPQDRPAPMVRNHDSGCFFRWIRVSSLNPDLKRIVRNAVQTCGLDFAAVDCAMINTSNGPRPTIFEINSAPGLVPRKVDLFVTKIRELFL